MTQIGQMLIDEGIEKGLKRGLEKGKIEGKIEGKTLNIISQVRKKVQKGYTVEETADALEEDTAVILPFFRAIENDPAATDNMIFGRIHEDSQSTSK